MPGLVISLWGTREMLIQWILSWLLSVPLSQEEFSVGMNFSCILFLLYPDMSWYVLIFRITEYCTEMINSEELGLTFATHSKEVGFLFGTSKIALRFEQGFAFSSVDQSEFKFPQFWLAPAGERSGIMMPMALWEEHQCSEGGFDDLKSSSHHKLFHDSALCVNDTAECISALLSNSPSYVLHELCTSYIVLCVCLYSTAREPISLHHLLQFWWNLWGFCPPDTHNQTCPSFSSFSHLPGVLWCSCDAGQGAGSGCGTAFPAAAEFPAMPCPLVVCCWPSHAHFLLLLHHWKITNRLKAATGGLGWQSAAPHPASVSSSTPST